MMAAPGRASGMLPADPSCSCGTCRFWAPIHANGRRFRIWLRSLRSEATVGEESCLFKELLGVVLLTFLLDFAELGERFVELLLHPGLVAEEQAHLGRFGRIDEQVRHRFGWVGFRIFFAV